MEEAEQERAVGGRTADEGRVEEQLEKERADCERSEDGCVEEEKARLSGRAG